jgi:hypothetical protein
MTQKRIPVLEDHSWQPPVTSILNTPPTITIGMRYIVGTSPTGAWVGHNNAIAWADATTWHFDTPTQGWKTHVIGLTADYWFNGTTWAIDHVAGEYIKKNASSTNNKIPQWDGTTGDQLKDGLTLRTTLREDGVADDISIASEKAVRDAITALLGDSDAMVYKGTIDCSANPNYPAADAGHTYKLTGSVDGMKIGGASGEIVEAGDYMICNTDSSAAGTQATVGTNWDVFQVNLDGAVIWKRGSTAPVSNEIAVFDDATGRVIKGSGATIGTITDHIADGDIHFEEGDIDHLNIQNIGVYKHVGIDTHIGEASIHRQTNYSADLKSIIWDTTSVIPTQTN